MKQYLKEGFTLWQSIQILNNKVPYYVACLMRDGLLTYGEWHDFESKIQQRKEQRVADNMWNEAMRGVYDLPPLKTASTEDDMG
ncbi:MAG: hypothetical protein LBC87_12115 [Fibromonadaceae bacterium]|jgi:hypothetical protein|nr:hypothetical protein [Fibromonadaceae bacterium]